MGQKKSTSNSHKAINSSGEYYDDQLIKRCRNVHFDVESWYKIISNETFPTEFLAISPLIAQAFIHFYQTRYMSKKQVLDLYDIEVIQSIENQLKEQIFTLTTTKNMFVRLSARSPKDGKPLDSQKIRQLYHEKFNHLKLTYPDEYQSSKGKANLQMIAFYHAQFHSLKVTNEVQALNLILTSERVYYDLIEVLDCQQVKEKKIANKNNIKIYDWNNNIIIRQWHDGLDPSNEFRCFVYQSSLTAISQYIFYCKYHHLQERETIQQIKITIHQYWQEKIQPLLNPFPERYSNYVIDIGLIENHLTHQYDCIVIEMNPFDFTTNPSLFKWTTDYQQLTGQGNELEIRVQLDYYPYIEDYIEFILTVNGCNEDNDAEDDHPGKKPYFSWLNQMKTQLSS